MDNYWLQRYVIRNYVQQRTNSKIINNNLLPNRILSKTFTQQKLNRNSAIKSYITTKIIKQ